MIMYLNIVEYMYKIYLQVECSIFFEIDSKLVILAYESILFSMLILHANKI